MKKIIVFFFILFAFLFLHVYQKTKIIVLAYEVSQKQERFDNLIESRLDLVYNFSREISYVSITKKLADNQLELNYPKKYVRLAAYDVQKPSAPTKLSMLVKALSLTSRVEAQP